MGRTGTGQAHQHTGNDSNLEGSLCFPEQDDRSGCCPDVGQLLFCGVCQQNQSGPCQDACVSYFTLDLMDGYTHSKHLGYTPG